MNLENQIQQRFQTPAAGKHLKPYQGLKQAGDRMVETAGIAGKHLKPYQGLKLASRRLRAGASCRKTPKTLSGIETVDAIHRGRRNPPENT